MDRILVTGGTGFLGKALRRHFDQASYGTAPVLVGSEFDLSNASVALNLFTQFRPDIVVHAAAKCGGIGANRDEPGDFFHINSLIGANVIHAARLVGVRRLIYVGTTCSYPKHCSIPFKECAIWDGYPEETNAPYGIAKRSHLAMLGAYHAQFGLNYAYLIPTNMFGPYDNFSFRTSHVIPAIIRKIHAAIRMNQPVVKLWGTGKPTRDFLYVDDAAEAIGLAIKSDLTGPVNIGSEVEVSISDLANMIAAIMGYVGTIAWMPEQPDGQPRRCLDTTRARQLLGFAPKISLQEGLQRTIEWHDAHVDCLL